MDLYPIFFLFIFIIGSVGAIVKGPIWGLLLYVYVYYNIPSHQWWGYQLPYLRWSLICAFLLLISCLLNFKKLSSLNWKKNLPGKLLVSLLVLMVIITPFTFDPTYSFEKTYDFFRYVIIYILICKILTNFKKYKLFIYAIIACTFYISIVAHHYFRGVRLDGVGLPDASDANMLSALFLLIIPLIIIVSITEKSWQRWITLSTLPFIMNSFVMCASRGAFVGALIQGIMAFFLLRRQIGLTKIFFCCFLLAATLFYLMDDKYRGRILGMSQAFNEESRVEASAGRWAIWGYGLNMARDYPFGAGGDAFMALSSYYIPEELLTDGGGTLGVRIRAAHNTWLTILVEQGVIGLGLFIGFLWSQFKILFLARQHLTNRFNRVESNDVRKIVLHTYALQISLAGFWTAAFFIDRVYFEAVYLIIGAAVSLALLTFSMSGSGQAPAHYPPNNYFKSATNYVRNLWNN